MKTSTPKVLPFTRYPRIAGLLSSLLLLGISSAPLVAEDVFVTSFMGSNGDTDLVPCPPDGGSCSSGTSLFGSSASSACNPVPVIPASARRTLYGLSTDAWWEVTPSDHTYTSVAAGTTTFTALHDVPGLYKMYITRGSGTVTHSTNLVMSVTVSGTSTLADTNGIGQTSLTVPFDRSSPVSSWIFIGYLTNSEASPTIHFGYISGAVDSTDNRWNMDAVRFQSVDLCTGVADQVGVGAPLAAGQMFVNVTGVSLGATNVTVYANTVQIGQASSASGFAAGTVNVPTSALIRDDIITAGQKKNGCSSTVPGTGPKVGGGPNPSIKVLLSCYNNSGNLGPIGTNGVIAGNPYILKADSVIGNFNTAPIPGQQLFPGACWQTVTFQHSIDPAIDMNSGTGVVDSNPFCALDSLVFSMDDTNSGPYDIYVDQIMNGDTVVEDFESYPDGSTNTFVAPNQAGVFAPASAFLEGNNSTTISTANAYSGAKSCRIQWQWANSSVDRWARAVASGGTGGKVYPQLDTAQPITVRYLVLPVGSTASKLSVGSMPSQSTQVGAKVTFTAAPIGEGPFTYQWKTNGVEITGATSSTYTIASVTMSDVAAYTVVVDNAACEPVESLPAYLVIRPALHISLAPPNVTLTWTGTFQLQSADSMSATFTDVTGVVTGPYTTPITGERKFFRLRVP